MSDRADVAVIGGGIVGLATAHAVTSRLPNLRLLVLEKEARLAAHQTGHNSGVIHSGIYYRPGSLKAQLCARGARQLEALCDAEGIPYRRCGKVIVAVESRELVVLEALQARGLANGVPGLSRIGPERLREIEPNVRGLAALHLPQAAIVDFVAVAQALANRIERAGGIVRTAARLIGLRFADGRWRLDTTQGEFHAGFLVNCGGLHADRLGRLSGHRGPVRIVPIRGEYYALPPARSHLVNGLV